MPVSVNDINSIFENDDEALDRLKYWIDLTKENGDVASVLRQHKNHYGISDDDVNLFTTEQFETIRTAAQEKRAYLVKSITDSFFKAKKTTDEDINFLLDIYRANTAEDVRGLLRDKSGDVNFQKMLRFENEGAYCLRNEDAQKIQEQSLETINHLLDENALNNQDESVRKKRRQDWRTLHTSQHYKELSERFNTDSNFFERSPKPNLQHLKSIVDRGALTPKDILDIASAAVNKTVSEESLITDDPVSYKIVKCILPENKGILIIEPLKQAKARFSLSDNHLSLTDKLTVFARALRANHLKLFDLEDIPQNANQIKIALESKLTLDKIEGLNTAGKQLLYDALLEQGFNDIQIENFEPKNISLSCSHLS